MSARILLAMLGWLALTLPGAAQDESQQPAADEDAQAPAGQDAEADGDESAEETGVDDFTFSEEIPADTQLVFPVDI